MKIKKKKKEKGISNPAKKYRIFLSLLETIKTQFLTWSEGVRK